MSLIEEHAHLHFSDFLSTCCYFSMNFGMKYVRMYVYYVQHTELLMLNLTFTEDCVTISFLTY